ncbi:M56 family metallopeptidase [Sedimentibacter sp.]|uniref:M56 family metallopeptidase n=1 Tax=Sedimentibacter sp. TaxID=1960295 RepID=UPI0028995ED1|nr:M56 family metallopeptidase [Sedimentibacter sp.]
MNSLFLTVLSMSLTASYAVIFVIIARFFLKKTPKIFSYALWLIVLFRLVCPFSFGSSVSMMPENSGFVSENIMGVHPVMDNETTAAENAVSNTVHSPVIPSDPASGFSFMKTMTEAAPIIWIIGITVFLIYGTVSYLKLKNILNTATLVNDNIFETDRIKTPFVLGIIRPKIYIPVNLSDNELKYIIKHEQTHIRRHDHIVKLISFFSLAIHWFNPLVWLSFFLMSKDMEMSCDESVMKSTGEDIRMNYSKSLLSLSAKQSGLLVPLAFGESNVMSRIKNILNYKKPSYLILAAAAAIVVCIAVVLVTNPVSYKQYDFPLTSEDVESMLEEQGIDMYVKNFTVVDDTRNLIELADDKGISLGINSGISDGYKVLSMTWFTPSKLTDDELKDFFNNELLNQFELAGTFYGNKKGLDKELRSLLNYYLKEDNYKKGLFWSKRTGNDHLRVSRNTGTMPSVNMLIMQDEMYEDYLVSTNEIWKATAETDDVQIYNSTVAEMAEISREGLPIGDELNFFSKHFFIKGYLKNIKENKAVPEQLVNSMSKYLVPNRDKYLSATLVDDTGSVDVFIQMTSLNKDELSAEREHAVTSVYNNGEPVYVVRYSVMPVE